MTLDTNDIAALIHIAKRERPAGAPRWDDAGIAHFIRKLAHLDYGFPEIHDRITAHARDRNAKTPAVLMQPITRQPLEEDRHPHPVKRIDQCPRHPGGRRGSCTSCAADRLRPETDAVDQVLSADQALQHARAAVRGAP